MAQFVRHHLNLQTAARKLHRLLHNVLHHAPAHRFTGAWMPAGLVHWEHKRPLPGKSTLGILACELMRQFHRHLFPPVTFPNRARVHHLPLQVRYDLFRQAHHAVLAPFCAQDIQFPPVDPNVLDAQVQRLRNPQPAAIEHPHHQIGRIARLIPHIAQQGQRVLHRRRMPDLCWPGGPQGVDLRHIQFMGNHLHIKEPDGMKSAVLGGGRDIMHLRQKG